MPTSADLLIRNLPIVLVTRSPFTPQRTLMSPPMIITPFLANREAASRNSIIAFFFRDLYTGAYTQHAYRSTSSPGSFVHIENSPRSATDAKG